MSNVVGKHAVGRRAGARGGGEGNCRAQQQWCRGLGIQGFENPGPRVVFMIFRVQDCATQEERMQDFGAEPLPGLFLQSAFTGRITDTNTETNPSTDTWARFAAPTVTNSRD